MDTTRTKTVTVFSAIQLPQDVIKELGLALKRYKSSIQHTVPATNWHITIAFIGQKSDPIPAQSFATSISLPFVTTISITHLGVGRQPDQLWAYIHVTPLVQEFRLAVQSHLAAIGLAVSEEESNRVYIPHIKLANLKKDAGKQLAESAAPITFPVHQVALLQSHYGSSGGVQYNQLAVANITA